VRKRAADREPTAETLRAATARIIGMRETDRARFGVAVSGGPDSMALLVLAAEAFTGRVFAATVDHQLRAASADEARLVARACATLGVPHLILTPDQPITGSVQAAARAARYALLEQWRRDSGIDWVMTAHHADDQLETLAMRLNRASGLSGLAGIRERQGHVLRPLLGVRRGALHALVAARAMPVVDDPSNRDPRFDRARMRAALADSDLIDPVAVAESARHLAQEEESLAWVTVQLAADRLLLADGQCRVDMGHLPPALRRRLLIAALARMGEAEPRAETLDRAIAEVLTGNAAMVGNSIIAQDAAVWAIRPAPPRRGSPDRSD
jgi:tRNA(Ile)-lysidine synthase